MTTTMSDLLLDEFEMYGRAAGWANETIRLRMKVLSALGRTAGVPIEELTELHLARWLSTCRTPATKATYHRTAKAFFSWLVAAKYRADNPVANLKAPRDPRGVPRPVSEAVLAEVLALVVRTGPGRPGPRGRWLSLNQRAWILLGAYAGLRVHEIAKIRGGDVDLDRGTLRVIGKGGKDATLPLHPLLRDLALHYPRVGFWFPSPVSTRDHIFGSTITKSLTPLFASLGYDLTAHQLRHRFGTQVLRASGGNLRVAQECLRHSNIAATAIYTLVDDTERSSAVLAL